MAGFQVSTEDYYADYAPGSSLTMTGNNNNTSGTYSVSGDFNKSVLLPKI